MQWVYVMYSNKEFYVALVANTYKVDVSSLDVLSKQEMRFFGNKPKVGGNNPLLLIFLT